MTRSPQAAGSVPRGVLIRAMEPADAGQVLAIYQAGLDTGQASFETTAPAWEHFDAARLPAHRHVAADAGTGQILGWTAAVAVSDRCVYAGVIEHSVYTHPAHRRRGIGAVLLTALIASAEEAGVWTIQSGVFPENTASLRLHEQAGFRIVGTRERIGRHHGRWRDTVLIERRSAVAGPAEVSLRRAGRRARPAAPAPARRCRRGSGGPAPRSARPGRAAPTPGSACRGTPGTRPRSPS